MMQSIKTVPNKMYYVSINLVKLLKYVNWYTLWTYKSQPLLNNIIPNGLNNIKKLNKMKKYEHNLIKLKTKTIDKHSVPEQSDE